MWQTYQFVIPMRQFQEDPTRYNHLKIRCELCDGCVRNQVLSCNTHDIWYNQFHFTFKVGFLVMGRWWVIDNLAQMAVTTRMTNYDTRMYNGEFNHPSWKSDLWSGTVLQLLAALWWLFQCCQQSAVHMVASHRNYKWCKPLRWVLCLMVI